MNDPTSAERFSGTVALIIGGTSGIGAATARRLSEEGARVVIAGRDVERGNAVAQHLGDSVRFLRADATQRPDLDALTATMDQDYGRLDVLVNAAGLVGVRPFASLSAANWTRTIETNLSATFHACQAALPILTRSAAASPAGTTAIVNVSSLNGVGGDTGMVAYSAAKAGVIGMTRSLALELIGRGIRVNCVSPGAIDTPMTVSTAREPERAAAFAAAIPAGRFGRPEEIAAAIAFVASRDASFMVGANLVVDGGVTSASGHPDLLAMFGMET